MSGKRGSEQFRLDPSHLQAVGTAVESIGAALEGYRTLSIELVGVNIKGPKTPGGETLLVVKGLDAEGTPCVAFHSAFTLGEAMRGLASRLANGTLKWRVDEYMK